MARKRKPIVKPIDPVADIPVTEREKLVVEGALRHRKNGKKTAALAGMPPKTGASNVGKVLTRPQVQRLLDERRKDLMAQHRFHTNEIVGGLIQMSRTSIEDVIDIQEDGTWSLDLKKAQSIGATLCIHELSFDRYGRPKVKMYDRHKAYDQLCEVFGLKSMPRSNDAALSELAAHELMEEAAKHGQQLGLDEALTIVMSVENEQVN